MTLTRTTIRDRARLYADVGSEFCADTELNAWLDDATGDLHDLLVQSYGHQAWAQVAWANVTKGYPNPADVWPGALQRAWPIEQRAIDEAATVPSSLTLPADFGRLVRVGWAEGTAQQGPTAYALPAHVAPYVPGSYSDATVTTRKMTPMQALEISADDIDLTPRTWTEAEARYRVRHGRTDAPTVTGTPGAAGYTASAPTYGWVIDLYPPVPQNAVYALQLVYVPRATLLTNDTDSFRYEDWADYVTYEIAARILEKQRSDASALRNQVERATQRIKDQSAPVDAANPVFPPFRNRWPFRCERY